MALYALPENLPTNIFTRMPEKFRGKRPSPWSIANRGGAIVDSFIEGPSFDRQGNLYVTDIPFGRVFRIDPAGEWTLITEYDGWPNGLKIHKDGRIFITDYRRGIVLLDPQSGKVTPVLETHHSESFKGVNDLFFASNGDLYFTDQGQSGWHDPTGRLYRMPASGQLEKLVDTIPSPNGLVLNLQENQVLVAVTRALAIWRMPLMPADGTASKVGTFIQLSGGLSGPDGLALDVEGGLIVAHAGMAVWRFDRFGQPTHRINLCTGHLCTNVAFGGQDNKCLFITESETGSVLRAKLPVAGRPMFSHQ